MATVQVGKLSLTPQVVLAAAKSARGWFLAIVILSFINTLFALFNAKVVFVLGLAVTQIIDGFIVGVRESAGNTSLSGVLILIGFVINLVPLGIYLLIWWLSGRGNSTAYLIGIILYSLDTLLMVAFQEWFGAAFHAYFLFRIIAGYKFVKAVREAKAALAAPEATVETTTG